MEVKTDPVTGVEWIRKYDPTVRFQEAGPMGANITDVDIEPTRSVQKEGKQNYFSKKKQK